jgi:uncharacterized protein YdeI (YjbR/CyaY-like superfamily)
VELDTSERKIELAPDVQAKLDKNAPAKQTWARLSFTYQREYHEWIESAKRPETRENRIVQMLAKLSIGEKLR